MTNEVLHLALICLAACCAVMVPVWLWARKINNAGVVDIFWSLNFPLIAVLLFFFADGFELRRMLICSMVFLEGSRLGVHLFRRVTAHLDEEEGRYKQLRKEWSPNADRRFFWFFQFQAISNVLLAIPFLLAAVNTRETISILEFAGVALWVLGFIGELIADAQLSAFKKDKRNAGKVCDTGLWRYSRHPNYFFQWTMWMAYFIFALGSHFGYLGIIAPAIILYLLLRVTGIPATEEQAVRSKGEAYKRYQRRVSGFVPWFRKD